MKTSGLFEIHSVMVPNVRVGEKIYLFPFGDIHMDSRAFSRDVWEQSVVMWKDKLRDHRCLFLGVGDYNNALSSKERKVVVRANTEKHEDTVAKEDRDNKAMVADTVKQLKFMGEGNGHILGLMNGNHFAEFANGTNSDQALCGELKTKYLGVQCFIRISFERNGNAHQRHSIDIFAHHGKGAARLTGSSFNTVEQMAEYADADVYIMGDDHSRGALPGKPELKLVGNNALVIKQRQRWLVRSGSYLKTHVPGTVSYIQDRALAPRSLGHVELDLTLKRERAGTKDSGVIVIGGHSPGFE